MGYNLNIDTDNEGALQLAMQGQQIPSWVYENSQIAHENKRIRLVALQLEAVEEAQQNHQQKQRGQLQKQEKESKNNQPNNKRQRHQVKKQKDDLSFE
ncbi:hypothetical protein [Limosilactobacillus reuteri]|uniref:Uncharacterized protein n=1 Tax=Limosilactobacillus reuteri TaxID=1598 RepID=A0A256SVN4_LIMRT|nr:hypothetical protein [Limosilactobacillus reuteri]OYS70860.1 hypothetical protein CBF96_01355 [Limosilactobacillus reuteri]